MQRREVGAPLIGVAQAHLCYTQSQLDAVATVYQSSVPYLLADNIQYEIILFPAYGLDIYSL